MFVFDFNKVSFVYLFMIFGKEVTNILLEVVSKTTGLSGNLKDCSVRLVMSPLGNVKTVSPI